MTTTARKRQEVRSQVFDIASKLMPSLHKDPERLLRVLANVLETYPSELLQEIDDMLKTYPTVMFKLRGMVKERRSAERVRECLMLLRLDLSNPMNIERYLIALRHYDQLPSSRDYSQEDEKTREAAKAIVIFTATLDNAFVSFGHQPLVSAGSGESFPMIRDERIVELLIENPGKAKAMAELMIERGSGEYELVSQMIENESVPLAHGLL